MRPRENRKVSSASKVEVRRSRAGLGLYAVTRLEKGAFVVEYSGRRISTERAQTLATRYLFELNDRITLDGSARSNLGRYANHACRPNAASTIRRGRVEIRALRPIEPGDEITYDYGEEYFAAFLSSGRCRCDQCARKKNQKVRVPAAPRKRTRHSG